MGEQFTLMQCYSRLNVKVINHFRWTINIWLAGSSHLSYHLYSPSRHQLFCCFPSAFPLLLSVGKLAPQFKHSIIIACKCFAEAAICSWIMWDTIPLGTLFGLPCVLINDFTVGRLLASAFSIPLSYGQRATVKELRMLVRLLFRASLRTGE